MSLTTMDMMENALANRGGTFSKLTDGSWMRLDLEAGYTVARPYGLERLPFITVDLINTLGHYWLAGDYLGLWLDPQGFWSIDRVEIIFKESKAKSVAKKNDQRAIWDNAKQVEIFV